MKRRERLIGSGELHRNRWRRTGVMLIATVCATAAQAQLVDVELRPERSVQVVGSIARVGLYLVAADGETIASVSAGQMLLGWDPGEMTLTGLDLQGAVALSAAGLPYPDPFGVNELPLPTDGDALFAAFAPLGSPIVVSPDGALLVTVLVRLDRPGIVSLDILEQAGDPVVRTAVFDALVPNHDLLGGRISGTVFVGACKADMSVPIGVLDYFDVGVFLQLFFDADLAADLTGDGIVDFFDASEFVAAYTAGCSP